MSFGEVVLALAALEFVVGLVVLIGVIPFADD